MKKFTLTTLLMLLFAFVAGAENFPQKERAGTTIQRKETGHQRMMQPRQQAPEQYPDIFGWLRYDERNQDEYGICKFNAYTPETIDVLHAFPHDFAASAGAFANGKYYVYIYSPGDGVATPIGFGTVDINTGEYKQIKDYTGLNTLFADMSFDYSTNTMYAIGNPPMAHSSVLMKVDLATGDITTVCNLPHTFVTMACSYEGQMYAVKADDGYLYTIDKTNGNATEIGYTYEEPEGQYLQSMEFDHKSNKLYWAVNTIYQEGVLAEVNLETGEATRLGTMGNNAQIVGLYIPFEKINDGAPAKVEELTAIPAADGSLSTTLSWKNPSTTFNGEALASLTKVIVYRDEEQAGEVTNAAPGGMSTWTDNSPSKGLHSYRVVAVNDAGNSESATTTAFVGFDIPKAPTNIKATSTGDNSIRITWTAPEKGVNNGWIDLASLKYKIVRMPDGKTLSEDATGTSFDDTTIESLANYSYELTAITTEGAGEKGTSNAVVAGPAISVPYFCNFATDNDFALWTVIDSNKDSYTWRRETTLNAAYYYYNEDGETAADDWLISSPIKLQTGKKYRLEFKLQSYDSAYPEKMEVFFGTDKTVEAMTTKLGSYTVADNNFVSYEIILPDISADGNYHLGFHCISDAYQFILYLTDVSLKEASESKLSGKVTDGSQPLEGVTVALEETEFSTMTNAEGVYLLEKIPAGTYNVTFDKVGFEVKKETNVTLTDTEGKTLDAALTALPKFTVSGKIVNEENAPVGDAEVCISGYGEYTSTSDTEGNFTVEGVYKHDNYQLTVNRYSLQPHTQSVSVADEAVNVGTITLNDKLLSPYGLTVETNNEEASPTWQKPLDIQEFRYDNGTHGGRLGRTDDTEYSAYGTVFRTPSRLTGMTWYIEKYLTTHTAVNVFIFDLNEEGNPTNTLLYSQSGVPAVDDEWNRFDFPTIVDAPRGYMVAISCEGHTGLGLDDGNNPDYPFMERTSCFTTDYRTGNFEYVESHNIQRSLMIRAIGIKQGEDQLPTVTSETKYNVWRMTEEQTSDESQWTLLTATPQAEFTFTDKQWGAQPQGFYRYAVKAVYKDGETGEATISESLANKMLTQVKLTLTTNTPNNEAAGVQVTLTNNDGDTNHLYTATAAADGTCDIADVWKGIYTVELRKKGFNTVTKENIDLSKEASYALQYALEEYIANPYNLEIAPTGTDGERTFTWNTTNFMLDDFEGHDDFAVNSPGKLNWSYIDGDNSTVYPIDAVDYPNSEGPMAYMIFNPYETDPVLGVMDSKIRPHSGNKFLAAFASTDDVNNDFIISPELKFNKDFVFKFFAKSYSEDYGQEKIRIGYSTSGKEAGDFVWLTGDEPLAIPMGEWKEYRYEIPASAKYVTLNCVSDYLFLLMVDDMFIGIEVPENIDIDNIREDLSFEVYLDGSKVGTVAENNYTFHNLSTGIHKAGVKAVFASTTTPLVEIEFNVTEESSVGSVAGNSKFKVYPNPTKGMVNIEGNYDFVEVMNSTGTLIARFEAQETINLGNCPKGIYILKISTPQGYTTQKLIVE